MWYMPLSHMIRFGAALALVFGLFVATANTDPASYDHTMRNVFIFEGGYANLRFDPGGPTNYGITIHTYRQFINARATAADIRAMPRSIAARIYRAQFWNAIRGDDLGRGLDQSAMDLAVNNGVGRARQFLRRIVGLPGTSGPLTDREIEVLRAHCVPDQCRRLINAINDLRRSYDHGLRNCHAFCGGWDRRIRTIRADSLAMAGAARGDVGDYDFPRWAPGRAIETPEDLIVP